MGSQTNSPNYLPTFTDGPYGRKRPLFKSITIHVLGFFRVQAYRDWIKHPGSGGSSLVLGPVYITDLAHRIL
ncbi:hypothetical protein HDU93_008533 [Gonapodya sp. JEL0774]|nr:hypothetical protein HDU93_008533 [Gonapodya sp. JEL0774]